MALQSVYNTTPVDNSSAVKSCEDCGFEDNLTYVTAEGQLPAYVCTFCVTNWPKQYLN